MAESIAQSAGAEVVRLPLIMFSGATGVGNRTDWLTRMLASCVRLAVFPALSRVSLLCWPADWLTEDTLRADQPWRVLYLDLLMQQLSARIAHSRFVAVLEFIALIRCDVTQPCFPVLHMLPEPRTRDMAPISGEPLVFSVAQLDRHIEFLRSM